jgi:hypothetical protein
MIFAMKEKAKGVLAAAIALCLFLGIALIAGVTTIPGSTQPGSGGLFSAKTALADVIPGPVVTPPAPTINIVDNNNATVVSSGSGGSLGSIGGGGGGGGGGGPIAPADPRAKTQVYGCESMIGDICTLVVNTRNSSQRIKYCEQEFRVNGTKVASTGGAAVNYLRSKIGGIWNNANPQEAMYTQMTGQSYITGTPVGLTGGPAGRFNGRMSAGSGPYQWNCFTKYRNESHADIRLAACGPKNDGRPFPYAVGVVSKLYNEDVSVVDGHQNVYWVEKSSSCLYVSAATPPRKIYTSFVYKCWWGVGYSGGMSENRAEIQNGGVPVRIQNARDTSTVPGNNATDVTGCSGVNLSASLTLADYAYYRLSGDYNYRQYLKEVWTWDPAWTFGVTRIAEIKITKTAESLKANGGGVRVSTYGVYSCSNTPDPYREYTYAGLPAQGTVIFGEAGCPQIANQWECDLTPGPQINNVLNNVELMRDGSFVPLKLPEVKVYGTAVRDSDSKGLPLGGNNMSYRTQVLPGSSPFLGTDPNASPKQYFEMFNENNTTRNKFGTWQKDPNANQFKKLTYYWSADPGKTWQMNYEARIDKAEWKVPVKDTSTSPVKQDWRTDTNVDCEGIKDSNKATILRSAGSE